tara:strand:- start:10099 stop:10482 length:384 start_codon:yes stop_codon:yes gene_type:complete
MPELGPLGTEIVGYLPSGRPIIKNDDNTFSTERLTTIEVDGKWINIPTMFNGREVSVDEAFNIMNENDFKDPETGKRSKKFSTMEKAIKSAESESKGKDSFLNKAIEQHKIERRDFPTNFDERGGRT